MTVERVPAHAADSETTGVIQSIDAPLPPYAQPSAVRPAVPPSTAPAAQPVPMSPLAPAPPPPGQPAPSHPQTVADAMVQISMPSLAAPAADAFAEPVTAQGDVLTLEQPVALPAEDSPAVALPVEDSPAVALPVEDTPPVALPVEPAPAEEPRTQLAPTALFASAPAQALPAAAAERITCPECGTVAQVTLNRRDSVDFCRNCDYPLFWTPSKVLRGAGDMTDESLRRLPGQAGRVTVASLPCPFCYEPNALSAQTCIRCNRPMHPVEEIAPPAPVYVPPPAPVVVEEQGKVAWWVWLMLAVGAIALIVLVVLIGTGTIS